MGLTEMYYVKADGLQRHYDCGSAAVAAKCFLSYVRRFRKERPTKLQIRNESGQEFEAKASWYFGKLKNGTWQGAEGEWYSLEEVSRLK